MLRISFLRPIDQFDGTHRFLQELKACLESPDYDQFRFSVAFAKSGPILRLALALKEWKQKNKTIDAIIGVDLLGTSRQALELALQTFSKVYVLHSDTHATFHPKFYLFSGDSRAVCYQGSHNLTVGGTETNLEGAVKVELDRPDEETTFQQALSSWTSLLPAVCPMTQELDERLVETLLEAGIIFDENVVAKPKQAKQNMVASGGVTPLAVSAKLIKGLFPRIYPRPPSPIPTQVFSVIPAVPQAQPGTQQAKTKSATLSAEALVIQIVPHHNGEVFLSKIAVNQNPGFFGFPFTGSTTPKIARNPSYPQRIPDPVVNITVYDAAGNLALSKPNFALNTVYYETKAEIRITFSPDIVAKIAPYSLMVMRLTGDAQDYDVDIFNPGQPPSTLYEQYLSACNQTMPSGGKAQARKMGWL
jgi:HKD family nuclease